MSSIDRRLENWCVRIVGPSSHYQPPELQNLILCGEVYDDMQGRWEDGHEIQTSRIEKVEGRIITTQSGTRYQLGKVSSNYVDWCEEVGVHVPTEEEPIKPIKGGV